jgi:HK97 family phage major capsid protein
MSEDLDQRLGFMVRQRLNTQILVGTGVAPNLLGVLNVVGIQTQAKGALPTPDAVYMAMTKIRVTGQAIPSAFVTNPLDWQEVKLLRTTDGIYIWGSPSEAGPDRIWGIPVVLEPGMTEGTGVVGDWANYSLLAERKGLTIKVGYQNDDFIKNQRSIVAEIRVALAFTRPAAFCSVTGI